MLPKSVESELLSLPHVSRETLEHWEHYVEQLIKWNQRINLVGPLTVQDVWQRHILDSAQLLRHIPDDAEIINDFGSGGGLPGLVLALTERFETHMVESNKKKSSFLRTIAATAKKKTTIHDERIENITPWQSDIVTARALAPMPKLLDLLHPFIEKTKLCLFLKGQNVVEEIEEATKYWDFEHQLHPSRTHSESVIVAIHHIKRRPS